MKILVAGPFLGELGWEVQAFQPYVRGEFINGEYDKLIVYSNGGKETLYRDGEVRTFDRPQGIEAACNSTMYFPDQIKIHQKLLDEINPQLKDEFKGDEIYRITGLSMPRCDLMLDESKPDKLLPLPRTNEFIPYDVCFVIRDRQFAPERNWPKSKWEEVISEIVNKGYKVAVVGLVNTWQPTFHSAVADFTNKTTIDGLIDIFNITKLVVGGSSGPMHLASRCGIPHLVWGFPANETRYKETNFFDTPHKVYTWGWQPEVYDVVSSIKHYLDKGEFRG